jgi:hypothetical protein
MSGLCLSRILGWIDALVKRTGESVRECRFNLRLMKVLENVHSVSVFLIACVEKWC